MGKRLFVGNLPFSATDDELRSLFAPFGTVTDVHIVMDRETSRSRGFGFVSFTTDEEALKATEALNGKAHSGRPLVVKDARDRGAPPPPGERPPRPAGGGPGGFRSGPGSGPGGFRGGPGGSSGPGGFRSGPGGSRPGGPPRDGAGGPARPWTPRPPRPGTMPPPEEMPTEDRRRFSVKKKKPVTAEGERTPKVRPRGEEEQKAGSWRQWIEDEYEETDDQGIDSVLEDDGDELAEDAAEDTENKGAAEKGAGGQVADGQGPDGEHGEPGEDDKA